MRRFLAVLALTLLFVALNVGAVMAAPGLQGGPQIHYVGFGESLSGIADRYGVSAEAIMQVNGLTNPDMIYVGQPLQIPGPGAYGQPPGYPVPQGGGCGNTHVIRPGETLSAVAWQYGVPVDSLLANNQLYSRDMVYVGQELCISGGPINRPQPAAYQNYAPAPEAFYHQVVDGDCLSDIAHRYGIDYGSIMRANGLNSAGFIWVGQRLAIPGYHPAPPPLPPAAPPLKPRYDDAYDMKLLPPLPPPPPPADRGTLPAAPDYQPVPVRAELPLASQPIEVVVNGGQSWVGEAFPPFPDPNEITTLIVSTADKTEVREVRIRSGDYEVKGELGLAPEFGVDKFRFAFRYIPPGDYDVWIDDPETASQKVHVKVEAGQRVEAEFHKGLAFSGPTFASPDGWYLAEWDNPSKPGQRLGGWSNILITAPAPGLWIRIRSEANDYQAKCFTGSKGPNSCDLAALGAGIYFIWIDGTDLTLKTYMDGNAYAKFTFARQAVPEEEIKIGPVSYP